MDFIEQSKIKMIIIEMLLTKLPKFDSLAGDEEPDWQQSNHIRDWPQSPNISLRTVKDDGHTVLAVANRFICHLREMNPLALTDRKLPKIH
jgi:hypothetical protein